MNQQTLMPPQPAHSVEHGWSSAESVNTLLELTAAQEPILDTTHGRGMFWVGTGRKVVSCDLEREADIRASFLALPFMAGAFPTVVYDPPYHPAGCLSAEADRFGTLGVTSLQMRPLFVAGLQECWRVTSNVLLVKCQHFVHDHIVQWMPLWAIEALGYPYEWLIVTRRSKLTSPTWRQPPMSLYRNHADYLIWKKSGHVRRR